MQTKNILCPVCPMSHVYWSHSGPHLDTTLTQVNTDFMFISLLNALMCVGGYSLCCWRATYIN